MPLLNHMRPLSLLLALALLVCLALTGCSSQRQTVTLPAEDATVSYARPDTVTLHDVPPVDLRGAKTLPQRVTMYEDTTGRPTAGVESVTVDRRGGKQRVIVRTRVDTVTVESTFALPTFGERLTLYADSAGLSGTIFGTPQSRDVKAEVKQYKPPWWERMWSSVRLLAAILFGGIIGYTLGRVLP